MNNYENIYILKGSLTKEQVKNEIEKIKKYYKNVIIYKKENDTNGFIGLKNLAYEVKKEKTGYYYITYFKGTEEQTSKINLKLKENDNVIKFITIRINEE